LLKCYDLSSESHNNEQVSKLLGKIPAEQVNMSKMDYFASKSKPFASGSCGLRKRTRECAKLLH